MEKKVFSLVNDESCVTCHNVGDDRSVFIDLRFPCLFKILRVHVMCREWEKNVCMM